MTALLSPIPRQTFTKPGTSEPAAGYKLHTYSTGTQLPAATYKDRARSATNTNPIILDANGQASVYLDPGVVYDYWLESPAGDLALDQKGVSVGEGLAELASNDADKGLALLGAYHPLAPTGPAYLKTESDIRAGKAVEMERFLPKNQLSAIRSSGSTYDAAGDLLTAINAMKGRGGELLLPHGQLRVGAETFADFTGMASDDGNTRLVISGQGKKASEIRALSTMTTGSVLSVRGTWGVPLSLVLRDFRITANLGSTRALKVQDVAGLTMEDFICRNGFLGWEFIDVLAINGRDASTIYNTYGCNHERLANTYPNLVNLVGGSIGGNSVYGMLSTGGTNLNLFGLGIEGNGVSQPLAAVTSWGVKVLDPGAEGGAAVNVQGCYFEVNNGQADLWVAQNAGREVCVQTSGNTFNRISNTNYTTNNIRLETTNAGSAIRADLGSNAYWTAGTYVRDTTRRSVYGVGVADSIDIAYEPSMGAQSSQVDRPALAQSGRINDPACTPQTWLRASGTASTVGSSRRLATYVRNGVGDYTITLEHDVPAAKCLLISLESSVPLCWQIISETGAAVNINVRNAAGALTDPTRLHVAVLG